MVMAQLILVSMREDTLSPDPSKTSQGVQQNMTITFDYFPQYPLQCVGPFFMEGDL